MRSGARRFWVLASAVTLLASGWTGRAAESNQTHKVIIYPQANETVQQLQQQGVKVIHNYGSYWLVKATDDQWANLRSTYGGRAAKANYLNIIELNALALDTTTNQPAVTVMSQATPQGKRLRLVQFAGPVVPEWLDQIKSVGQVKVVSHIPNNAYVVSLDAAAERNLQKLLQPAGPVQWIGPYHPSYKLQSDLPKLTRGEVDVRIGVVDDTEADQTIQAIRAWSRGPEGPAHKVMNQRELQFKVDAAALPQIAQLPGVLWVERVAPGALRDEVQDLIVANRISGPGHSPVPGIDNYYDFLVNQVGFSTNSLEYPVVDVADTGLDKTHDNAGYLGGLNAVWHPDFYQYPTPTMREMSMAMWEPGVLTPYLPVRIHYRAGDDLVGHGTGVASIIAGAGALDAETLERYTAEPKKAAVTNDFLVCVTNSYSVECNNPAICPVATNNPPRCCTNVLVSCFITNVVKETPYCLIHTNDLPFPYTQFKRDSSGFQYGMGISPFGRVGSSFAFGSSVNGGSADPFALVPNAYLNAARISNNSWGEVLSIGGNDGVYGAMSRDYDVLVRDAVQTGTTNTPAPFPMNQEFVAIFAGGNANGTDPVGGFGDVLITPPATAKNVIAVGAAEGGDCGYTDSILISYFNSFGPTRDGRFKPEIVAPGQDVVFAYSTATYTQVEALGPDPDDPFIPTKEDCTPVFIVKLLSDGAFHDTLYRCSAGTSFAAPTVSGAAQLLWWYFQHRLVQFAPSPAMVKAYIANSARYLPTENPITHTQDQLPSIAQGMGELDLERMFDGMPRVLRDQSTPRAIDTPLITTNPVVQQTYFTRTGQSYQLSGQVYDPTQPFRVTLAWSDAPGDPAAFKQLVNDLDLAVTVNGQTYLGNVFIGPNSVSTNTAPGRGADDLNNLESVFLPPGQTGQWSIVVNAVNLAGDGVANIGRDIDQDFALVVYNATPHTDLPNLQTNNTCQTATVLTVYPVTVTNTIVTGDCATCYRKVHPNPAAGRGGAEAFWKIPHPATGILFTVSTLGSSTNMVLSIWRGVCGALVEVISSTTTAPVPFVVDGASDYYVVVEGLNGANGQAVVTIEKVNPTVIVTPNSLQFGTQVVGVSSPPQVVTLSNNGLTPLAVQSAQIAGLNPDDYSIVNDSCSGKTMLSGSSCGISVSFRPTSTLVSSAELQIFSGDLFSPHLVSLGGTGLVAGADPRFIPASVLNFGAQAIGSVSAPQSVLVSNAGAASMVITNIAINPNTEFTMVSSSGCLGNTLRPGDTCVITIQFNPAGPGTRSAVLSVSSTASSTSLDLPLVGSGVPPPNALTFTPPNLDFGEVLVGATTAAKEVTAANTSSNSVSIIGTVKFVGANQADFKLTADACSGATLLPGSSCTVSIDFTPGAAGDRLAQLSLIHNGQGNQSFLSLSGRGIPSAPRVCLTPIELVFNQIPLGGTSVVQKVTLTDCGNTNLLVGGIGVTGPNAADFLIVSNTCSGANLPVDGSCQIGLRFVQSTDTTETGTLTITNNAVGSPHTVALSGGAVCAPVTVRPETLPVASVGLPYSVTFVASGAPRPFTYSYVGELPPGLGLVPVTGVLTGAPTTVGSFIFTVTATSGGGCAGSRVYTNTVICVPLVLVPQVLPDPLVGQAYSNALSVVGGIPPYSFALSLGKLPPGLNLSANGVIAGTVVTRPPSNFNFKVSVSDTNGCTGERIYAMTVRCPTLTLAPSTLPSGAIGSFYRQTITASGGTSPYRFGVTSGSLPSGLTLTNSGPNTAEVSGTPTTGSSQFTVTATDANNCSSSQSYTLLLQPGVVGGLWSGATDLGGGWKRLAWFGDFYVDANGWIYHAQHKWLYPYGTDTSSITFWDNGKGLFWWTSASVYPYVYRFSDASWLWYQVGSHDPRWFYSFSSSTWESW